nr:G-type lectin S-receptor-like serine/threonine-protein kinase At1g67520 [Tanacetum cinerariifolium]
ISGDLNNSAYAVGFHFVNVENVLLQQYSGKPKAWRALLHPPTSAPSDTDYSNRQRSLSSHNQSCLNRPRSYSYEFHNADDLFANYTVKFCPPSDTFSTIKPDRKLNSHDQLVSVLGNFTLGFFDEDGSYLGIWYTSDAEFWKLCFSIIRTPET